MKIIKIISENKKCNTRKIVIDERGKAVTIAVPKPKRGFIRVEAILRDTWGQLWTRHIDIKKNLVV